jgi:hypothetical protein
MSFLVELPESTYRDRIPKPFVASTSFDGATARAMAWLAQLAYEQDPKIKAVLDQWGLVWKAPLVASAPGFLPVTATRGFVADGQDAMLVVFAGTDPMVLANWLTDFNALPTPDGMHAGFEAALRVVWPTLQSVLRDHGSGKRLLFAGHSLGAAIAALAARHASDLVAVEGVYAFGMPRCGSPAFAEAYDAVLGDCTYRLVNGHDVVPTVPPSRLGFRHVGRSLLCRHGEAFDLVVQPSAVPHDQPLFIPTFVDGIRSGMQNLLRRQLPPPAQPGTLGRLYTFLPPAIGDHLPARYLRALGALPDTSAP